MIETDGVSSTILFLRNDWNNKKIEAYNNNKRFSCPKENKVKDLYIDELKKKDLKQLSKKKIVAIDPGKCDLIYCVDDCSKDASKFRYSQDQIMPAHFAISTNNVNVVR